MEAPSLTLAVDLETSSDGSLCSYEGAVTPPVAVTLGPIVVNAGGTGVLNGNVNSYTLNQYIVPPKDTADWSQDNVKDLVTDAAAQLSTDTKKIFFPKDQESIGDKEVLRKLQRKWCFLILALVGLSTLVVMSTVFFSLNSFRTSSNLPFSDDSPDELGMEGSDLPGGPTLRSRAFWVAQPPTGPLDPNTLPVKMVIVCHTATDSCNSTSSCIRSVRYIQQFHIDSNGWADIGYNYLVGGDGNVYVGRGWNYMGAHTKGNNNGTVGIAFVGTYTDHLPSAQQVDAFDKLVQLGVRLGKVAPEYSLLAQCQLMSTAAPGAPLVKEMASWPHYNASIPTSKCIGL